MIEYTSGDILEADTQALVNPVNLNGYMGRGLAYQFKKAFPENHAAYRRACESGDIQIGCVFVYRERGRYIVNFATKDNWRDSSTYDYIRRGMDSLVARVDELGIESVAVPPLGCGNGGLAWSRVEEIIVDAFATGLGQSVRVVLYQPSAGGATGDQGPPRLGLAHYLLMELKLRLQPFAATRLQAAAYILEVIQGSNRYSFTTGSHGPFSARILSYSRAIAAYQHYYHADTREAARSVYQTIVSKTTEREVARALPVLEYAASFVNAYSDPADLQVAVTVVQLVHGEPGLSAPDIVEGCRRMAPAGWSSPKVEAVIAQLTEHGLLTKTLLGYEVNRHAVETMSMRE